MNDTDYSEERYLLDCLAMLQEGYTKAAKPYVDRLVAIRSMQQPKPMFITLEQAKDIKQHIK